MNSKSSRLDFMMLLRLTSQLATILHMNPNPLLFNLSSIHGITNIMPNNFNLVNMKMHNILQSASLPLMQSTVKPQLVPMLHIPDNLTMIVQHIRIQSNKCIRSRIVIESRLHLHKQINRMQIPFVFILSVVLQFYQMPLPIFELLTTVFVQTMHRLSCVAFF